MEMTNLILGTISMIFLIVIMIYITFRLVAEHNRYIKILKMYQESLADGNN